VIACLDSSILSVDNHRAEKAVCPFVIGDTPWADVDRASGLRIVGGKQGAILGLWQPAKLSL